MNSTSRIFIRRTSSQHGNMRWGLSWGWQLACALLVLMTPRVAAATSDVGPTASLLGLAGKELEYAIIVEAYEGCESDGCEIYAVDTRKPGFTPLFRRSLGSFWNELFDAHCQGLDPAACGEKIRPLETERLGTMTYAELDLERYLELLSPTERAHLEPTLAQLALPSWTLLKQTPGPSPKGVTRPERFSGEGHRLQLHMRKLWDVASVRAFDGNQGCDPRNLPACQTVTRYVNGIPRSTWSCPQRKVHNEKGAPIDCGGRALMVQVEARLDGGSIVKGSKTLIEPFKLISNWRGMIESRGMAIEGISLQVGVVRVPHGLLVVGGLTDGAMNGTWFPAVMTIPFEPLTVFTATEAQAFVARGQQPTVFPLEIGASRIVYDGTHEVLAFSRFFDLIRKAAPDVTFTRHGKTLLFDYQLLQFGEQPLYDGEDWSKTYFRDQIRREDSKADYGVRFEPLSLVGDVVSWAIETQHHHLSGFWMANDLSTGKPPVLTKLFDEASLIAALLDNPCIREGVEASGESRFATFAQLTESYKEPPGSDCPHGLHHFSPAFAGYDEKGDLALVELGYARTVRHRDYAAYQMDFYIQPTPTFRENLKKAKAGDGFFVTGLKDRGIF